MKIRRLALLASILATTAGLGLAGHAEGSCAAPPSLEEQVAMGDVVFVGTVRAVANLDRTATFAVEEQWMGEALPAVVEVHGGIDDLMAASSVDRTYQRGVRYLVVAYLADGRLTDNSCSATQPWADELAALRPADAVTPPPTDETSSGGIPMPMLAALAGLGVLAVAVVLAFRRGAPSG